MSKKPPSRFAQSNRKNRHLSPAISKLLLFFTVTLSGGAVMIVEVLGTRIIAPYYRIFMQLRTV